MSKLVCQWQGARLDREQGWKFSDQVRPFYHPLNVKLPNSQRCLFWQLLKENKSKTKQIQTLQTTRKIRKKQKRKTKTHIREGAAASVVTNPFSHSLLKSKALPSFHTSSFPLVSHHLKDQQEILGFFVFSITLQQLGSSCSCKEAPKKAQNLFALSQNNYFNYCRQLKCIAMEAMSQIILN